MNEHTFAFFKAYSAYIPCALPFSEAFPAEMLTSVRDDEGWVDWKWIEGNIPAAAYHSLEKKYGVQLPQRFIEWHRSAFFLDADCALIRLPASNPRQPLLALKEELEGELAAVLISQQLYPFAQEGNDAGPLVFDGRKAMPDNEFPVRVYEHEYSGHSRRLSEVIFSSLFLNYWSASRIIWLRCKTGRTSKLFPTSST